MLQRAHTSSGAQQRSRGAWDAADAAMICTTPALERAPQISPAASLTCESHQHPTCTGFAAQRPTVPAFAAAPRRGPQQGSREVAAHAEVVLAAAAEAKAEDKWIARTLEAVPDLGGSLPSA